MDHDEVVGREVVVAALVIGEMDDNPVTTDLGSGESVEIEFVPVIDEIFRGGAVSENPKSLERCGAM
jgi:hypothetical protein